VSLAPAPRRSDRSIGPEFRPHWALSPSAVRIGQRSPGPESIGSRDGYTTTADPLPKADAGHRPRASEHFGRRLNDFDVPDRRARFLPPWSWITKGWSSACQKRALLGIRVAGTIRSRGPKIVRSTGTERTCVYGKAVGAAVSRERPGAARSATEGRHWCPFRAFGRYAGGSRNRAPAAPLPFLQLSLRWSPRFCADVIKCPSRQTAQAPPVRSGRWNRGRPPRNAGHPLPVPPGHHPFDFTGL